MHQGCLVANKVHEEKGRAETAVHSEELTGAFQNNRYSFGCAGGAPANISGHLCSYVLTKCVNSELSITMCCRSGASRRRTYAHPISGKQLAQKAFPLSRKSQVYLGKDAADAFDPALVHPPGHALGHPRHNECLPRHCVLIVPARVQAALSEHPAAQQLRAGAKTAMGRVISEAHCACPRRATMAVGSCSRKGTGPSSGMDSSDNQALKPSGSLDESAGRRPWTRGREAWREISSCRSQCSMIGRCDPFNTRMAPRSCGTCTSAPTLLSKQLSGTKWGGSSRLEQRSSWCGPAARR